jgi:hypothetical protein
MSMSLPRLSTRLEQRTAGSVVHPGATAGAQTRLRHGRVTCGAAGSRRVRRTGCPGRGERSCAGGGFVGVTEDHGLPVHRVSRAVSLSAAANASRRRAHQRPADSAATGSPAGGVSAGRRRSVSLRGECSLRSGGVSDPGRWAPTPVHGSVWTADRGDSRGLYRRDSGARNATVDTSASTPAPTVGPVASGV